MTDARDRLNDALDTTREIRDESDGMERVFYDWQLIMGKRIRDNFGVEDAWRFFLIILATTDIGEMKQRERGLDEQYLFLKQIGAVTV